MIRRRHPRPNDFLNRPCVLLSDPRSESTDLQLKVYRYSRPELNLDYELDGDVPEWQFWNPNCVRRNHFFHHIEIDEREPEPALVPIYIEYSENITKPKPIRITRRIIRKLYEEEKVEVWTKPSIPNQSPIDYLRDQIKLGNACGHRAVIIQKFINSVGYYRVICAAESCQYQHAFDWKYSEDIVGTANELIRKEYQSAKDNIIYLW